MASETVSGWATFPKEILRDMELVGDDGSIEEGHLVFEQEDDGTVVVEPV